MNEILHDHSSSVNIDPTRSLSEEPATAAHSDCSATGIPDEWTPATIPPPEPDDWEPETPSLSRNVKGGGLYRRPVANSGCIEFAKGLERSGNPLQAAGNYAGEAPPELRSAGLPSGERPSVVQAMAADPSRRRIEPTAADYERLAARSVGHRGPADARPGRRGVSNTPPQITEPTTLTPDTDPRDALTAIHYLASTVPVGGGDGSGPRSMAFELAEYLWPGGMYLDQDFGRLGYTRSIKMVGGGDILYHPGEPGMGVHISLSGKALEAVALTPVEIISTVLALGGSVKRLDVYADSHDVPLSVVREACKARPGLPKGFCVSKARSCPRHDDLWKPDAGETVYIGSRGAQRFVRFYDKSAEQELTPGVDGNPAIWSRCEVELKREQAHHAALLLVAGQSVRNLVFSCVDFRDRSKVTNVTRAERLPWWEKWSGAFERVSFAVRKVKEVVEGVEAVVKEAFDKAVEWVTVSTTSSLAFIDETLKLRPSWAKELGANAAGVKNWAATLIDSNRERIPGERRLALQALQERDVKKALQAIEQEGLLDEARRQAQQAQQAKVNNQFDADKLAELSARFRGTFKMAGVGAA